MNWVNIAALEPLTLEVNVKLAVAIIFGMFLGVLLVKCDFADRVKVKENLTFLLSGENLLDQRYFYHDNYSAPSRSYSIKIKYTF